MITKENVEDLLFGFGITPNLAGFRYIVDAVTIYDNQPICHLYRNVAHMNNTNYASVERAIRHAFSKLDFHDEKVVTFFGNQKRNNGELIATIHLKLSRGANEKPPIKSDLDVIKRFKDLISKFEEELDKLLEESEEKQV